MFLDGAAAWLSWQYYPTGRMLTLNNAQTFFQQLKQKYFIFACDNGSDQILFYTAFTHAAAPQYQVTGYRFAVDYNVDQRRQYIWRDENETLHQTTPSFGYSVQLDAAEQAVMSLCDLGTGIVLAGAYKNAYHFGKIYRSTDYGQTWTPLPDGYVVGYDWSPSGRWLAALWQERSDYSGKLTGEKLFLLSLADANSTIARLQSRMDEAEAKIQNLTVDNRRLSGSETELTQNLAAANQAVDALQKELKSRSDRVTQIEIAYQKLRGQSGTDAQKLAQLQQLAAELQGIYQRREVYSNSILRRYKQINEQYRSMSGVMQAQRTDAPATGGADLARIQDSIAMAEEDLRQLDGLNAQALRIQKKMAGK